MLGDERAMERYLAGGGDVNAKNPQTVASRHSPWRLINSISVPGNFCWKLLAGLTIFTGIWKGLPMKLSELLF